LAAAVVLLLFTSFIGYKQFCYYFGGPGVKDGVFVRQIRQASEAEKNADILLSVVGGLLFVSLVVPAYWFLTVALYSALVVFRCYVTLKRAGYWRECGGQENLRFIPKHICGTYRNPRCRETEPLQVDRMLAGWIFSHAVLFFLALGVYCLLIRRPSWTLFFGSLITYFSLYFFALRSTSYKIGPKLLEWFWNTAVGEADRVERVPRFIIKGGREFALEEYPPWRNSAQKLKRSALRIGWRCVSRIPAGLIQQAEDFVVSSGGLYVRSALGHDVNVSGRLERSPNEYDLTLVVDLWTRCPRSTGVCIQRAAEVLDKIRAEVNSRVGLGLGFTWTLKKEQEFLDVKPPRFVLRAMTREDAIAAITSRMTEEKYRYRDPLPTMELAQGRLKLGPEPEGAVDAVRRYLQEETSEKTKESILESSSYHQWISPAMAGVLLATWMLPLKAWSVGLVAFLLVALMVVAILPVRYVGWSTIFHQTTTVASLGFFGIGVFGIAYSLCALVSDDLGPVTRLGYPFLVSTGLGVAGGILGDNPKGIARILAHVQLLLFLGGLVGVFAVLLRIERGIRERG
jgi:hypothetical protein